MYPKNKSTQVGDKSGPTLACYMGSCCIWQRSSCSHTGLTVSLSVSCSLLLRVSWSTCCFLLNSVTKQTASSRGPALTLASLFALAQCIPVDVCVRMWVGQRVYVSLSICWYVQWLLWVCINSILGRDRGL